MKQEEILGVRETVAYYVSNLVGAGILVVPAIAYAVGGQYVLGLWVLLIIASWPMAKIFAIISIRYPHNSGILNFLHKEAPNAVSQFADDITIFVMLVGNPILGFVAARYAISAFALNDDDYLYPLAFLFMFLSVAFNMLGLRNSSRLQFVLTFLTLGVLLTLAATATWTNHGEVNTVIPSLFDVGTFDLTTSLQALGICFFVFVGWENVAAIAPNVRDRMRTFNRSIVIAVPLVGVCYLFIAFALALSATQSEAQANFAVLDLLTEPLTGTFVPSLVSAFSIVVVVVSCNAWVLAASKVLNGLSSSGRLPRFLSKGSESTPRIALIVLLAFYALVIFLSYVFGNHEDLIIQFVSAGFIMIYAITLWHFFVKSDVRSERGLALFGLVFTLLAASGLFLEVAILILIGSLIWGMRKIRSRLH